MSFIEALATTARRIAKRGPYYAKAFGLMAGPVLCLRVESRGVRRSPGRLTSVALPGFAGPVWMRDTVADRSIVWQNLVRQHYTLPSPAHDEAVMERYARGVAENRRMLVLDCGGNIGLAAIWYARLFPKATIVTLEPDPENFALLLRNVAPYPNIHAIQGGIWSTSGSMCIANPERRPMSRSTRWPTSAAASTSKARSSSRSTSKAAKPRCSPKTRTGLPAPT